MFRLIGGLFRLCIKIAVLGAGIGLIIAYANLSDLDGWKKDMADQVMRISGRRLSFDGNIEFKVSMPPRIIAHDVRIQNAHWGSKKDMLKADMVIAEIDFLPLLVGDVAVPRLRLVGADILVETNAAGEVNWDDLNNFQTASGGPVTSTGFPAGGPIIGSGGIGVSGGTLTIANMVSGAISTVKLPGVPIAVSNVGQSLGLPCW